MPKDIVRDHEVTRTFATHREHRMAQIDRLYDFEPDPEPVTVKATLPGAGEPLAHFHMDNTGKVTNLIAPSPQAITQHLLGIPADDVPGVVIVPADEPELPELEPIGTATLGGDYLDGMNLGQLLVFARDLADSQLNDKATIKAWTRDDGTVIRLAAVNE